MKKILLTATVLLITSNVAFSHRQHVHQTCAVEGYNLLKKWIGGDVPPMTDHIGGVQGGSTDYVGTAPWQKGFITTGAWREDCEDVVYGKSSASPPAISGVWNGTIAEMAALIGGSDPNDAFVSSTHFWYADNGDELATDLCGHTTLGSFKFTIPNAYQKIQKYANGYWDVNCGTDYIFEAPDGHKARLVVIATGQIIGRFQYHGLIDVFKNRDVYVHLASGAYKLQTDQGNVFNYTFSGWQGFLLNNDAKDRIVWEIVGRMCHLLQDLGSPAHANDNPHGGNGLRHDSFEEYFGDIGWTADMVYAQNPAMLDPCVSSNPLHLLMYTMQQQANHFASNGPVGDMQPNNDTFGGNPLPEELAYLGNLNMVGYDNPTTVQESIPEADILNERDKLFPQIIRETAALLYWFGKETGIITPFTVNISRTFEFDPAETLTVNSLGGCLSVSSPASYTKNGRQYFFAGWSDGVADNLRAVSAAANLTALYKMVHKSNDPSAFANNSQRKFVQTFTGTFPNITRFQHMVYQSMGHVWYEYSTNNGVNWTIGNGGQPLDFGNGGKCPSIDYNGSTVLIVFQQQSHGGNSTYTIELRSFYPTGSSYLPYSYDNTIYYENSTNGDAYAVDANPSISCGFGNTYVVAFERKNGSTNPAGINIVCGALYSPVSHNGPFLISDNSSINTTPTVYGNKGNSDYEYHLAWENHVSSYSSSIRYRYVKIYQDQGYWWPTNLDPI